MSMLLQSLLLILLFDAAAPLKFLCYSPRLGYSHVNFLGKLSDSLIDAGHEVVIISSFFNSNVKGAGSTRARVIDIPETEITGAFEREMPVDGLDTWDSGETWQAMINWVEKYEHMVADCNALLHLAGIEKFAITESISYKDGLYGLHQVPTMSSYVPSIMGGSFGEDMTFCQRAYNLFNTLVYMQFNYWPMEQYRKMFESNYPGFPDIQNLMALNSLYFLNSDPLIDFPRPSAARVIDIGGIAVSNGFNKLDQKWSAILDLRPQTVYMSFGTFAQAHAMPEAYKETIRATARALPDVTFIWKYENPEHNVTQGIPNLLESTWVPQNDMLRDPRLSLFVTHCGAGSTTEANYAGTIIVLLESPAGHCSRDL
ncbi:hypothetical protein PRIPAC_80029 [Pristionchus pacificus]|uniref:glucuronosyltransferase n=1 Tax=Pristionchus pacificus TaxID=54126 RepID=A0A2A6CNT7_PRIPA|nr:hypothetical protein PRIPAC_80029 [Pristionchus pacificus]|eukprot:PDM79885.1 glucuronosyltransferase [Pristionchus pacificus]